MAASQAGSRAGLITTLVIFVILFFIAAILAMVNMADKNQKDKDLADLRAKYQRVISNSELANQSDIGRLLENNAGQTVYGVLTAQTSDLSKLIAGSNVDPEQAQASADKTLADVNDQLKQANVSVPAGALNSAIVSLAEAVKQRTQTIETFNSQLKELESQLQQKDAAYKQAVDAHVAAVEKAKSDALAATGARDQYQNTKDQQISELEKTIQTKVEDGRKTAEELAQQLAARQQELARITKERDEARTRLAALRPSNMADAAVRSPDGKVIQTGRNGVVYINLGLGQQVTPGMTFQIYDRNEGIPRAAGNSEEELLPPGKGSLEIVRVGPGSSEARVISLAPGTQVIEGDYVANLVYDPNIRWAFKAYGSFDIDQNGVATPNEADIVKRLITQWGGRLTEDVNVDTDFVVLGKEPVLPDTTREEREQDAQLQFEYEKAEAALKAYDAVKNQAMELNIPVLNQNRFLYLVGFYDQAKK